MMSKSPVWHVFNKRGLVLSASQLVPFSKQPKGLGSCCYVSRSFRGQGWAPIGPAVSPHLLTDWQMGSGGQHMTLPVGLGARKGRGLATTTELLSPAFYLYLCVVVYPQLSMMIRLSSFSKHFCRSINAVSKWGVMKQLAGNMAMWNEGPWQMMSHTGKASFAISCCMKNPTDFCLQQMDLGVRPVGW